MSPMPFKFKVGQLVEYAPWGDKPALFRILKHMPVEDNRVDVAYLISPLKAEKISGWERVVLECNLSGKVRTQEEYDQMPTRKTVR
jgi:hypothetical protein